MVIGSAFARWEWKDPDKRKTWMPLPGLTAEWKFSESWATNITVITTALAAVFGSTDVLKAILGDASAPTAGLMTVAAAIALAGVTAAPLLVLTFRTADDKATPLGLLLGSFLTVAATGGQLGATIHVASDLNLEGVQRVLPYLGGLAGLLLIMYAARSFYLNLMKGLTPAAPAAEPLPPEKEQEIQTRIRNGASLYDSYAQVFPEGYGYYPPGLTSPGDTPRSALL